MGRDYFLFWEFLALAFVDEAEKIWAVGRLELFAEVRAMGFVEFCEGLQVY